MITGYNTDVRHGAVGFHVQTEDKGRANPCVDSLVYVGGQVLASKRTDYSELLAEGKGEKEITALMEYQHRVMIAAVKAGKFDEKLALIQGRPPGTDIVAARTGPVPVILALNEPEKTLDQVILDYLAAEAEQEQLALAMTDEVTLALGGHAAIELYTSSSRSGEPIAGAAVTVKMISTVSYPRTLAVGETDGDGRLRMDLEIPPADQGVAALIITAASSIGNAELKHLL
jgi:hypothetical protein